MSSSNAVSTLSPDSRASSNWSGAGTEKSRPVGNPLGLSTRNDSSGTGPTENPDVAEPEFPPSGVTSLVPQIEEKKAAYAGDDVVHVIGVRPAPPPGSSDNHVNLLPDHVISEPLRKSMQDLEAPVWQFSPEEALKPVVRRRRKARRRSSSKKAPFMSPGSASGPRSGSKRKLVDLTDFKTPPLTEPGKHKHAMRQSASSSKPATKDAPVEGHPEPTEAVNQQPDLDWSESKSSSRGKTFSRWRRQDE